MAFHLKKRICEQCKNVFDPKNARDKFCSDKCRFYSKINIVNKTECWTWTGWSNKKGYGRFGIDGKNWLAHRAMWLFVYGILSEEQCVLHKCDNPTCVNPHHLFLGTPQDNVADCVFKNRQAKGEKKPKAKLTKKDVIEIRKNTAIGGYGICPILAKKFNVSIATIYNIKYKQSWKHI